MSFDYENPAVAQKVAEKLASFFIDTNARERGSQADQTSAFLEAQMTDARTRLEAQEKKLKDFRERNAGRLPTQMQTNMQAIQNAQLALAGDGAVAGAGSGSQAGARPPLHRRRRGRGGRRPRLRSAAAPGAPAAAERHAAAAPRSRPRTSWRRWRRA